MLVPQKRTILVALLLITTCLPGFAQDLNAIFADPLAHKEAVIRVCDEAEGLYKKRVEIEPYLFKALNNSKLSGDAKRFIADQLYKFADEDSVPALSKLLYRRGTGDIARRGLEQIEHPDALHALLDALKRASGSTLTGVIESLGRRRATEAIRSLRQFVQSGNTDLVRASLTALGEIGGLDAAQLLGMARLSVRRSLRADGTKAYLRCGWVSLADGDRQAALDVFDSLLIEVEPIEVRQEAMRGLVQTERENSIPVVIEALEGTDTEMQAAAAKAISTIEGEAVTLALVSTYADLTPPIQQLVVAILGERRDPLGLPTVIQSMLNRSPEVRLEALRAIGKFNHPDTLQTLLKVSATGTPEERKLAQNALRSLDGPKINAELVKSGMSADNAVRLEAVKMMSLRNATRGIGVLTRIAERDLPEIQFESLKTLGVLGTPDELELMIRAWTSNWSPEQRAIIGEGIVAIAQRSSPGEHRVRALHDELKRNTSPEVQNGIIDALSRIQEDASISTLRTVMRKADPSVQSRIIQVFGDWPSDAPATELEKIARYLSDATLENEAFEALATVLEKQADPASDATLKLYKRTLKLADTQKKRDRLLPGVQRLTNPDAPELLQTLQEANQ
ncbi:MAG: HEAT repeat domain-containing protein [Candidatus Hydrogenedentota bacterium]